MYHGAYGKFFTVNKANIIGCSLFLGKQAGRKKQQKDNEYGCLFLHGFIKLNKNKQIGWIRHKRKKAGT
jgi:hypothetical protein